MFVMDENENVAGDINSTDLNVQNQLKEVLLELRSQREEVQALKEEVQGNNFSVASEVKKVKIGQGLSF